MPSWSHGPLRYGWRLGSAAGAILLAACLPSTGDGARAQEHALAPPKDIIFARKILMGAIDANMDAIERMTRSDSRIDLPDGREHADTISIMLLAFPHMFPPSTNQWRPDDKNRDPALDTYASPDLWRNFRGFYGMAQTAANIAAAATRAKHADEFKTLVAQLRVACNSCHAGYLKQD